MKTVLITGGTGLIGQALTKALLRKRYNVIILSRSMPAKKQSDVQYAQWDIAAQTIDSSALQRADAIVHLAGANVAEGRWTEARKKEIRDSRVQSGALLLKTLRSISNRVKVVVSASGVGWYGEDPQLPNPVPFVEEDKPSNDFLGRTCVQWEQSLQPVTELGKRLVIFRTGIVLSNGGGAYAEFKKPLRFGVAPVLGSGRQMVSWIHIDDVVNLYLAALEGEAWSGVYNAVAPHPVSSSELIKTMAQQRGGFHITAPIPEAALKLMLGEMSVEILKSTTASSKKVEASGYTFSAPHIGAAINNLQKTTS